MVVAEQMQHGVHREILRLVLKSAAVLLALRFGTLEREDHVAQVAAVRVIVHFVDREREHVRRPVHAALLAVDGVDALVVRERDADLARLVHALGAQRCGGGLLYERGRLRVAETALFPVNVKFMLHRYFLL